jgi:hypothetical protein
VVNRRKLSKTLSHDDVKKLREAMLHASLIDRELDTLVTFSPWRDQPGVSQDPVTIADVFRRFLKHVGVWAARHTGGPFTAIRVCHADEDGSRPHLHIFMHAGNARRDLQVALDLVYPAPGVVDVRIGSDRSARHPSGFYGSTFGYLTRFRSQQAFVAAKGREWRASRPDEKGHHRGIACPFMGRRWAITRNLGPKDRTAHRISNERRRLLTTLQQSGRDACK